MATASSQDNSALIDQTIPQWKRELILRRRALARTLPAGNTSVKLTCPSVVAAVRHAEQGAAVENVSGKQQRCISSAIASNKGLLDQAQADFHPRGRIGDSSSPSTTVTAAVVGNMRLVEHHADACTDLMINGVGLDSNTLSIDTNSLKYISKMGEEKSIKKACASSRTIMDNSVVMSENNNCSHPRDEECQSDSSEELQYGPGIVNKLKSKYMSMTLRENQNRGVRPSLANMRRAASLENMLDSDDLDTGKPQIKTQYRFTKKADAANNIGKPQQTSHHQQRYRGISRGNDSLKRARSVETLFRYDSKSNISSAAVVCQIPVNKSGTRDVNKNSAKVIKPIVNDEIVIVESQNSVSEDRIGLPVPQPQKMRTSSVASERELPPPDLVKQTLKIFEGSPVRKPIRVPGKVGNGAAKTHAYNNVGANLSKLNTNASSNINLSGSSSKPLLSPKPSPEKIRRNAPLKPPSPKKVAPVSPPPDPPCTSPILSNRLCLQESSYTPPLSPTSSVGSVGVRKVKSPTSDSKKFPFTLRDSSDSEPLSLSPIPHSSPVVNGRTDSVNLLSDDDLSTDEDSTDGVTKPVSRSVLENISKDGMSMQFNFKTNGNTSSDKSYLPSVKSAISSAHTKSVVAKSSSPVIEKPDSVPSPKTVSLLPGLKSPESPQTQQKQVGVIRPIVSSKVTPSAVPSISLTDREIEKNLINREKSIETPVPVFKKKSIDEVNSDVGKGRVEEGKKNVLPSSVRGVKESKGPGLWDNQPWSQQNSVKFNFTKRKDIPSYIENDGLILRPKREKPKPGESGIIVLDPNAVSESSTDGDLDDFSFGFGGPPSPCNVLFEGDNVLINGRSNLRKQTRQRKLRISFNDAATTTYEYPSEASFLSDALPPAPLASPGSGAPNAPLPPSPTGATPGVPFGGSSLASYTPSKVQLGGEDFQLGVTRSAPRPRPPAPPVPSPEALPAEEDYLKPAEDSETVAWSAETAADLLF